jgi:enamine deaminase RidA (YjgF/YER057c/UK114 family)
MHTIGFEPKGKCRTGFLAETQPRRAHREDGGRSARKRGNAGLFPVASGNRKAYGYTHAIKIGDDITVSGAVGMNDEGNPTDVGDLDQVLKHFGYTFDDVIVDNVFTTDMERFLEVSAYRNSIYRKRFPTGTWLEVKGLVLPEFMIEIELEAHKSRWSQLFRLTGGEIRNTPGSVAGHRTGHALRIRFRIRCQPILNVLTASLCQCSAATTLVVTTTFGERFVEPATGWN